MSFPHPFSAYFQPLSFAFRRALNPAALSPKHPTPHCKMSAVSFFAFGFVTLSGACNFLRPSQSVCVTSHQPSLCRHTPQRHSVLQEGKSGWWPFLWLVWLLRSCIGHQDCTICCPRQIPSHAHATHTRARACTHTHTHTPPPDTKSTDFWGLRSFVDTPKKTFEITSERFIFMKLSLSNSTKSKHSLKGRDWKCVWGLGGGSLPAQILVFLTKMCPRLPKLPFGGQNPQLKVQENEWVFCSLLSVCKWFNSIGVG